MTFSCTSTMSPYHQREEREQERGRERKREQERARERKREEERARESDY